MAERPRHRKTQGEDGPHGRRGRADRPGGPRADDRRRGKGPSPRGRSTRRREGSDTPRPRPTRPSVSQPRQIAFDVLTAVAEQDSYANLVLPALLRERGLGGRDAAFATELTYGTLRLQGRYQAIIDRVSDRAAADLDAPVARVLYLGSHQLLQMRVPAHAAVSESVALARAVTSSGPANFVNAVLRRISAHPLEYWLEQLGPVCTPAGLDVDTAAAVHSHPAWIVRAIRAALGAEAGPEELQAALAANNDAPPVTLALRPGLSTPQDLPEGVANPGRWAATAQVLHAGDPGALEAVGTGAAGVQDEGSQLVTLALAAVDAQGPDQTWLDLCAGPGGKAALLGALLAQRAPHGVLVANEIAAHRARLVRESLRAVRPVLPGLQVRTGDGREVGQLEAGRYDRVLVDAPCTGLGALRRRPEARWRRTPADLAVLTELQRQLLTSALQATRSGGVVGYVTCSPHPAETAVVVEDVLRAFPDSQVLDAGAHLQMASRATVPGVDAPMAQLWPHRHGTDAMFLALIRR